MLKPAHHHHPAAAEDAHHHSHQGHHYLKKVQKEAFLDPGMEQFHFLSFPRSTRISDKDDYVWPKNTLGVRNGKIKVKPLEYNKNERKIMPIGSKVKVRNLLTPPTFC
jgi:hypothetical protein